MSQDINLMKPKRFKTKSDKQIEAFALILCVVSILLMLVGVGCFGDMIFLSVTAHITFASCLGLIIGGGIAAIIGFIMFLIWFFVLK